MCTHLERMQISAETMNCNLFWKITTTITIRINCKNNKEKIAATAAKKLRNKIISQIREHNRFVCFLIDNNRSQFVQAIAAN